ncbi:RNA polymerase 2 transcription elongation factor [Grosmannia clavigera kw1407]|uniref:RNA polymerase 2 transcription elongation factor n=1 Tax=Grosmannia clavigera (strain kw1407 / UAMH 11150) TaxID=655863 RepID=F0XPV5_GROCL|nr:RNA polymerase 2 transcription elongation factor [Grosmannia clavigera kw1407]EFX00228.1 RNA polymerase 2 transcription elongation factor [Grosmannia clavigera kw1407]
MASSVRNGHYDGGANGSSQGTTFANPVSKRFLDVPATIDVPTQDEDEAVEIGLENLVDDPTDLCDLFENENAARTYWMTVSLAYAKQGKIENAIEMLVRGGNAMQNNNPKEKLSIVACLCWMYLWKSRLAPRVAPEGSLVSEARTKEYYLQLATSSLNEASRINPAYPPLFLARGVLLLLRASLQQPSSSAAGGQVDGEKAELLRAAMKSFDDALRVSQGRNMLALMGKSRALYSIGKYAQALSGYQEVLQKAPTLVDPDPRIGIGCCFWQLGFKEDAKAAWERCLEINADSKVADILLGLYYLNSSAQVPSNSPDFIRLYKKAMTENTQKAFKLDKNMPLACSTFAGYFLSRKSLANVESLAQKAIQNTDVNAIASDGWYLLARKAHLDGDLGRAADYYRRSDEARGGTERGYLPAKFGVAQLSVVKNDLGEAKLRLEKMIQQSKSLEAMALLGTLYAEEVFASERSSVKEDKAAEKKKAIALLESVRGAWKDAKKNLSPDSAVLLNLGRLYEGDQPDRALQCLQQVEQIELDQIVESEKAPEGTDEATHRESLRKLLPPQLLNNVGCFYYQADKHEQASQTFELALDACVKSQSKGDDETDADALVTTISYNLGRSYEVQGVLDKAVEVYEGLLKRHGGYTEARLRLAYMQLRQHPNDGGPDAVAKLYQDNPSDLEVRALYGWYLGKVHAKKRPANIAEDLELRHYKHTLQNYDKHDRYALVGMGNLYLLSAREMRRETEQERQKRSATYSRAVEFFEKALQLDPKNGYAAQGIAIALVEDRKDYRNALPIFLSVRDTVRGANVYVNLGHIYAELRQFSKAIENYEVALTKEGKGKGAGADTTILSCLGRTWFNKAKVEKDLDAYKEGLECAKKALEAAPEQVHFKFNVAFVQIQLASTIYGLSESQRTLQQLQEAASGLEEAIKALDEIAAHPQTPYPKQDVEQRANMARNTQRRQLERAIASQRDYEEKNKEKLAAALEQRQAELRRREEERQKVVALEQERKEKIRKEREAIAARDRELAEKQAEGRAEEERSRREVEMTTDSETGEKVKRKRKSAAAKGEGRASKGRPRRKKARDEEDEDEEDNNGDYGDNGDENNGSEAEDSQPRPKKRRLLSSRSGAKSSAKFKSSELVHSSDDDDDDEEGNEGAKNGDGDEGNDLLDETDAAIERRRRGRAHDSDSDRDQAERSDRMEMDSDGSEKEDGRTSQPSKRGRRGGRVLEDESDEEAAEDESGPRRRAMSDDGDESVRLDVIVRHDCDCDCDCDCECDESMDHFNVTVQKNGTLVSTRRGLQVSKHKHNGISFVNASGPAVSSTAGDSSSVDVGRSSRAADGVRVVDGGSKSGVAQAPKPTPTSTSKPKMLAHRWKFVTKPVKAAAGERKRDGGRQAETETETETATPSQAPFPSQMQTAFSASTSSKRTRKQPQPRTSKGTRASRRSSSSSNIINTNIAPTILSMPAWTCRIPQLDEAQQRAFYQSLQLVPRKIYPFEDLLQYNPARSSEFYAMVVRDPAAVRCVLLCGAMFRAVLGGGGDSGELAGEVAHVCAIVSEQLAQWTAATSVNTPTSSNTPTTQTPPPSTLECITTLALMGGFTGRYDHWHVHMRGLRRLVELQAGTDGPDAFAAAFGRLPPSLQTKMRKTDLKGAIALGTAPYLPFVRSCANASDDVLTPAARSYIVAAVAALLAPFGTADTTVGVGVGDFGTSFGTFGTSFGLGTFGTPTSLTQYDCDYDDYDYDYDYAGIYSYSSGYHHTHYGYAYGGTVRPPVIDAVGQLCVFARAVQLTAHRAATNEPLPLDPYSFSEELHWLQHQLVCQPAALRDSAGQQSGLSFDYAAPPTLLPPPPPLLPVDPAGLQTDDFVRNHQAPLTVPLPVPAAYDSTDGTPVSFLEPALRICALLYLKELIPDFPRNLGGYAVLLHLLRTHLRPSLWLDGASGGAPTPTGQLLTHGRARAVLLWVCLLGDAVSRIADTNERRSGPDCYDRSVFRARLVELVSSSNSISNSNANIGSTGIGNGAAVHGTLLPDGDWALCHLLDLPKIRPGGEHDQQAVLQMLAEAQEPSPPILDGAFIL